MKFILSFLLVVSVYADEAKVVFDLTTSSMQNFEKNIFKGIVTNKAHYESELQALDAVVVIHGGAYKFFVKDPKHSPFQGDSELIEAHDSLRKRIISMVENYDVTFLMCKAALGRNGLKESDIYNFVTLIPNSTLGLIQKQNEGYAYIPVN